MENQAMNIFTWIISKVATQRAISSEGTLDLFWLDGLVDLGAGEFPVANSFDVPEVGWSGEARTEPVQVDEAKAGIPKSSSESQSFTESISSSIVLILSSILFKDDIAWNSSLQKINPW